MADIANEAFCVIQLDRRCIASSNVNVQRAGEAEAQNPNRNLDWYWLSDLRYWERTSVEP